MRRSIDEEDDQELKELKEKQAAAALKADRIRQLTETEGWKQLEEWIKQNLAVLAETSMNPGYADQNSYILARGKYQGLELILTYVNNAIKIIKTKDE